MASMRIWKLVEKWDTACREKTTKYLFRNPPLSELFHLCYALWWTKSERLGWAMLLWSVWSPNMLCRQREMAGHAFIQVWRVRADPWWWGVVEGGDTWTEEHLRRVGISWQWRMNEQCPSELQLRELIKNRTTCFPKIKGRKKILVNSIALLPK